MTEVEESSQPSEQFVAAKDGIIHNGKSLWMCNVCHETFWHNIEAAERNDWEHTCRISGTATLGSLTKSSEPGPEALEYWAERYDSSKTLAQLVPFLEAGFKLAKRRLMVDSDSGQYLTNLATMTAFKDVLDFVRKERR